MFSVGFLWQIKSPARHSGGSRRAGSGASGAAPGGIAGQGGPSAGAFPLSPAGSSPTRAPDPGLGKSGRESRGCPGWAAVSCVAGTTFPLPPRASPWKPLQPRIGAPAGSAPAAPPATCGDPPAPLPLPGPQSAFPRLVRRWAGARLASDCREEPLWLLFHPDRRVRDRRGVALDWAAANGD